MTTTATSTPTIHTLKAPGATLAYDVRRNDAGTEPVLFLIGSPMGAAGFNTLAGHFADRTVVTYDPRGTERSVLDDPASGFTIDDHADDLHRIIQEVGGGPVDLFASSGGAVNALALVAKHPEDVRTLVDHEPPLATVLPDREHALAASRGHPRHVPAQRLGRRHGPLHRRSEPHRAVHGRGRRPARAGSGDVRHAGGATTAPARTRCSARP